MTRETVADVLYPHYDPSSLEIAGRQLAHAEDVMLEQDGEVPPWLAATRTVVRKALIHAEDEIVRADPETEGSSDG